MDSYVPGARPDEFIPNDNGSRLRVIRSRISGNMSQSVFGDWVRLTMREVPNSEERIEVLFAVVPFCRTEKERLLGLNDKLFPGP